MHKHGLYHFAIELFDANSSFKFHKHDVWDFKMSVHEGAKGDDEWMTSKVNLLRRQIFCQLIKNLRVKMVIKKVFFLNFFFFLSFQICTYDVLFLYGRSYEFKQEPEKGLESRRRPSSPCLLRLRSDLYSRGRFGSEISSDPG